MKREDIIRDIHGLDSELAVLEEQYGLLSADFYHCYRAGELEQSRDFMQSTRTGGMSEGCKLKLPGRKWMN